MLFILQKGQFEVILLVTLLFSAITNGALLPHTSLSLVEIHLVWSLTYISHRYFSPGRSLVIPPPATYRDIQQELIAEIHRSSIWPVVVAEDGNVKIPEKSYFVDRDGSYIILIPDGNIKSLKAEINGLAEEPFGYTRLRNSEARFVVAGANEFSMSQQMNIFNHLPKFILYNCIIVSQEYDLIEKVYRRRANVYDLDKGIKLGVYTSFPYQISDRCTDVKDITLLDSWVISAQGHFTKNTDLFPRKISISLNGCPMKAFVRDARWEFTTKYVQYNDTEGNARTYISGLVFDFLMVVLQQMNMIFSHAPSPNVLKWR